MGKDRAIEIPLPSLRSSKVFCPLCQAVESGTNVSCSASPFSY